MTVMSAEAEATRNPTLKLPDARTVVLAALCVIVLGLSFAPLCRLIATALAPDGAVDPERLVRLLGTQRVLSATTNTLLVAVFSTLVALLLGIAAALLVALTDMRAKTAFVFAFMLPMMIPPQVTALAWVQALSPSSAILQLVGLGGGTGRHPLYSAWGIVLLLGIYNAPLVFLSVRSSLRRVPGDLVDAARSGGASPLRLVGTIILPLARNGILAGAALSFVSAAGNFGIQAMLGIPARFPTLITLVYQRLNSSGPSALPDMAVLSLLIAAITLAGLFLQGWIGAGRDVRVDGAARVQSFRLGGWRPCVTAGAWLFLFAVLALPLFALASASLVKAFGQPLSLETVTFANYANALFHHQAIRESFITSLSLTGTVSLVLVLLALPLGYFLTWHRSPTVRVLQLSTELTYALPGVVIGIAAILFFLKPLPILGFSIYGTVWIILAAYIANFLALALRPTLSGLTQIDPSLEEAAQIFGAGFLRRFWDIIVPLAAPAAAAGAILVFITALNEIQVSILLVSSSAQTIGPMIVFLEEAGASTLASAVGCLMVLAVFALMLIVSAFANRLPEGVLPWRG